jgi:hypothetical protein
VTRRVVLATNDASNQLTTGSVHAGQPPQPPHEQADQRSVTATGTCPHCSPGDLSRARPRRAPGRGGPVNGRFQTRTHDELWHARGMPLRPEITTPLI